MPWTTDRYPPAMQHLSPPVRAKAIAIANAVLAHDGDEGKAIRIGIAQAKRWAARRWDFDAVRSAASKIALTGPSRPRW